MLICGESKYTAGILFLQQPSPFNLEINKRSWVAQDLSAYDDKVYSTCQKRNSLEEEQVE